MYEPRRVADPIAPPAFAHTAPARASHVPRHAAPTLTERVLSRGGIALAVVAASATAGAVVVGSTGGAAVALGTASARPPAASPAPADLVGPLSAAGAAAPVTPTRTAEQLAAPAVGAAKSVSKALVSVTPMYTTASVNLRTKADKDSGLLGNLALGERVSATTEIDGKYRRIEFRDGYAWVLEAELSEAVPVRSSGTTASGTTASGTNASGTTWDPCPRGSAVERRLRKDTIHIYRSVCALFPAVNSYGGWRSGGLPFHRNGRAVDIMLTPHAESALGHRIASYLIAHAKVFNVDHIIFEQRIWTPHNPRWRKMADRGSLNANHYNHVHVAINA